MYIRIAMWNSVFLATPELPLLNVPSSEYVTVLVS